MRSTALARSRSSSARRIGGHVRETLSSLPGVQVMGSAAPDLTGPTSAFAFPGRDPLAIRKALWTRGKVATAASVVEGQGDPFLAPCLQ
jgi:selenocysteine lyase/cysteine desulfurase